MAKRPTKPKGREKAQRPSARRRPRPLFFPETPMEALHRVALPARQATEPVLVFLAAARKSGKLDAGEWFKLLRDCFGRVELAEAAADRSAAELARLTKRLVDALKPEEVEHAKAAGCAPEVYAIELLGIYRANERNYQLSLRDKGLTL